MDSQVHFSLNDTLGAPVIHRSGNGRIYAGSHEETFAASFALLLPLGGGTAAPCDVCPAALAVVCARLMPNLPTIRLCGLPGEGFDCTVLAYSDSDFEAFQRRSCAWLNGSNVRAICHV